MSTDQPYDMPHQPTFPLQGAIPQPDGSARWNLWAPYHEHVTLVTWPDGQRRETPMEPQGYGYFAVELPDIPEGLRYAYKLPDGAELPDPASRWQPDGVHEPSAVLHPTAFNWSDHDWRGLRHRELVIYELHVGAVTPEGTFDALIDRLPDLVDLGVTAIELMPITQFPGSRNWGYDVAYPYAPQNTYGGPHGLHRLVDAAHHHGLAVILDLVYNHFGPEGNYIPRFAPYLTEKYGTLWGPALNFDDDQCEPVRRFVVDNARMWVWDYHIDGFRLDATHVMFDQGPEHILAQIQRETQLEAARRPHPVHVIAEDDLNDTRLLRSPALGGYGLDGTWADDFHHAIHALLTGGREAYGKDFGAPGQIAKALNDGFVYDGWYSPSRQRYHGSPIADFSRDGLVVFIQNHDQVGNRPEGDRQASLFSPAACRLAVGLMIISPATPMLFMGEEYGETRPFLFFCSFSDEELIEAVRKGRREEFADHDFPEPEHIPDPQAPETFEASKLSWSWPEGSPEAATRALYHDLLRLRRHHPGLIDHRHTDARTRSLRDEAGNEAALLIADRGLDGELTAVANLSGRPIDAADAFPPGKELLLSTEQQRYGGQRHTLSEPINSLLPYELVITTAQGILR